MRTFFKKLLTSTLFLGSFVSAINAYKSKRPDGVGHRFVKNSGVCETTPGVQQVSGYIDVGKLNMSMVSASVSVLVDLCIIV